MPILDTLRSKVGQQIRVPVVYMMTQDGKDSIKRHLNRQYLATHEFSTDNDSYVLYHDYRFALEHALQATGDELVTRRGKWVTRFRKELKSRHILLTDQQLGRVGDYVMMNTDQDGPWFVDILSKLDWKPGDFGDEGSCFWSGRAHNRDMMEFYHALALRTYRSDDFLNGTGRVWIAQPQEADFDYVMLFNSYGKRLDKFSHIVTRLLAMDDIQTLSKHVDDFGNNEGDFWTNNGEGYAISSDTRVQNLERVRLGYADIHGLYNWQQEQRNHYEPRPPTCVKCGSVVYPTLERPYIERNDITHYKKENQLVCNKCIDKMNVRYCDACERFHPATDFFVDLHGHEFCLWYATWYAVCRKGHVVHVNIGEFTHSNSVEDFIPEHVMLHGCDCADEEKFIYLYGAMCDACAYEVRISGVVSSIVFGRSVARIDQNLSRYGQRIERKEK